MKQRRGFTLVEMLVAVAIMLVLVTALVVVGGRVLDGFKERTSQGTIKILVSALEAHKDYNDRNDRSYDYPGEVYSGGNLNASIADLEDMIEDELNLLTEVTVSETMHEHPGTWDDIIDHEPLEKARYSMEYVYFFLQRTPDSRDILANLPPSAKTNIDGNSFKYGTNEGEALIEVVDAWQRPLRYENRGQGNFPLIISAGKDGIFNTADDLRSSEL